MSEPSPATTERARRWPQAAGLSVVAMLGLAVIVYVFGPEAQIAVRIDGARPITHDGVAKGGPLLIDKDRVLYAEKRDVLSWHAVPLAGGSPNQVVGRAEDFQLIDVKRDAEEYLAVRHEPAIGPALWVLRGGDARRVGSVYCHSATWSPDGSRIACSFQGALRIISAEGAPIRQLTQWTQPDLGSPTDVRWHPHDGKLRFTMNERRDGETVSRIWEVLENGDGLRPLFADWAQRCCGEWTPDGRHYIFEMHENDDAQLFALSEHRGWFGSLVQTVTKLTNDAQRYYSPRISSDGRTLFALALNPQGELVRFDPEAQEHSLYLPGISGTWITFTRDRQSMAYIGEPDKQLWLARGDGSNPRPVTSGVFAADCSVWSPDGQWLAFTLRNERKRNRIHLMPRSGGETKAIGGPEGTQGAPSWSQDGKKLVFGEVPVQHGEAAGGEQLSLYDLASRTFSVIPDSAGLWSSRWSPNGDYIAATTIVGSEMRLLDIHTGRWRAMPASAVDHMTWSSDSRFVYYHTNGNQYMLRRISIPDGVVEDLTDLRQMPTAAYWWSGLTSDDRPLLLRRKAGTEIHALTLQFQPR